MKSDINKEVVKKTLSLVEVAEADEGEEEEHLVKLDLVEEEGSTQNKRKGLQNRAVGIKKRLRSSMNNDLEKKERRVKVASLPVLVLERVFSYLDWKDLGTAMLVCQRWSDVAGQPSLWTRFPLRLGGSRLDTFSKIRRLDWIKSVTVTVLPGEELENCKAVLDHFDRMEELFINGSEDGVDIDNEFFLIILNAQVAKNRLRCGIKMPNESLDPQYDSQYTYFVGSCDAATTAFVKKTLTCEEPSFVFISGLPGVHASFDILETSICKNKTTPLIFQTNLMIGQDIDVLKLGELLKQHVKLFDIRIMCEEDLENQEIAPINAILDVLGGGNTGSFLLLGLPIELLLRSHWVERLGGAAKVEAWED